MISSRSIKRWALALLAAAVVVGLVRIFALASFRLPDGHLVWVNRWSYGLRLPFTSLLGYARIGEQPIEKGDRVAFDSPLETGDFEFRQVFVGYCAAGPGDTLRLRHGYFRIPRKGEYVEIDETNCLLIQEVLQRHEKIRAIVGSDGHLYIDGMPIRKVRLTRDYYWMQNPEPFPLIDSRTFGLLPIELVIGRIIL